MENNLELKQWIADNDLQATFRNDRTLVIDEKVFVLIYPKIIQYEDGTSKDIIVDENFELMVDDEDMNILGDMEADYILYQFGNKFYYNDCNQFTPQLRLFKWVGIRTNALDIYGVPHLGIHGGYELLSGSGNYEDYCKKAKFFQCDTLGICEKNTLAGTLAFQFACQKYDIKPVIGESVTLLMQDSGREYDIKLFVMNEEGWRNLLRINACINVHNEQKVVTHSQLADLCRGLVAVGVGDLRFINFMKRFFKHFYYQIDTVEYLGNEKDTAQLEALKGYANGYRSQCKCAMINDSYYLDKQDAYIRKHLHKIANVPYHNQSNDQYFKDIDQAFESIAELFVDEDKLFDIFTMAMEGAVEIAERCDFTIPLGKLHLPKFVPKQNITPRELYYDLLTQGLQEKGFEQDDDYITRLEMECEIIEGGGFIDYFLILWDIVQYCKDNNIKWGIGRGSAGGSLVSYLLGITHLDPLKYNLFFERFLNAGRLKSGLPDIDFDVQSDRRDEVKRYMEQRYGIDYVASIGTYTTMKIKAGIQDVGRVKNVDPKLRSYVTSVIDEADDNWGDLFKEAVVKKILKKFVCDHTDLIEDVQMIMNQPKSASVHAAGVIIVPKVDDDGNEMTIYDWLPIKKIDGVLVSEWEGAFIEGAGFLKEDILGIRQLQKFSDIIELIKEQIGDEIDMYNLPLDDPGVYELFQKGYNEDVFHFGSSGLKGYCQDVLPTRIEDLIATNALYRPGSMRSNAHHDYVKFKFGEKEPVYDKGLEDITRETYGVWIFQEQVLQATARLGGFDLNRADDLRKGFGKKIQSVVDEFEEMVVQGAIKDFGYEKEEAQLLWAKFAAFAGYSFNKSHAAAYSITGYTSQWFKHNYPLQFWTVALRYAKDDQLSGRVSEINKIGNNIKISPPDINKSDRYFISDIKTNTIYWSLDKISQVGDVACETIMEVREKGAFFSLEEFYKRVPKSKVKRNIVVNLILGGAFDDIEGVEEIEDRLFVLEQLEGLTNKDGIAEKYRNFGEHDWILTQKNLTGFGYLSFKELYDQFIDSEIEYIEPLEFLKDHDGEEFIIAGVLQKFIIRKSKKQNREFAQILIENNDEIMLCTCWSEAWEEYKKKVEENVGRIVFISGEIKLDNYRKSNVLYSNDNTEIIFI